MNLIYATGNPAKFAVMKECLKDIPIKLEGLDENRNLFPDGIPGIEETGSSPVENAKQKAIAYYQICRRPLFSCDSGLFIEGLLPEEQPGVHVRVRNGKRMSDREMQEYYLGIVRRFGGKCRAQYRNGICLVLDEEHIYTYEGDDISGEFFYLTAEVREQRREGFPLDAMSLDGKTGVHCYDLETETEEDMTEGFVRFFEKYLGKE